VWYFSRINVPSHLPSFIHTAPSLNQHHVSPVAQTVAIHALWDNVRLHSQEHVTPMYILWSQGSCVYVPLRLILNERSSIIMEHEKQQMLKSTTSPTKTSLSTPPSTTATTTTTTMMSEKFGVRFHSIYRDMLYLSFVSLGRENIDVDAFDKEYKAMLQTLPPYDTNRLKRADRTPHATAVNCRKMFSELEI
ncbi:hypothetical protein HELRODRAFT_68572, partial [Helobdella robusta]|uniref:Uncharacterized protein n=1 Tax=Helobdella robusta TaxID=6412 RepID=T1FZG8_HELRO